MTKLLYTSAQLLTKGKFKEGMECPRKVFYYNNRNVYEDSNLDDDFLKSLAKGGYQVGELAKAYYPTGVEIKTLNPDLALEQTNELLKKDNCVIFEAAINHDNLFARVDILVKNGNLIQLIEVKAKSMIYSWFDAISENDVFEEYLESKRYEGICNKKLAFTVNPTARKFQVNSEWRPYVFDVAFQTYVAKKSSQFKGMSIESFLCCPDKNKTANVDQLNQKFMVYDDEKGMPQIKILGNIEPKTLGESILSTASVSWIVDLILENKECSFSEKFEDKVTRLSEICKTNTKPNVDVSSICKSCRFNAPSASKTNGFEKCVEDSLKISSTDLKANSSILEIWNYKPNGNLGKEPPVFFIKDLSQEEFNSATEIKVPLNQHHRQLLQVNKIRQNDNSEFLATTELKSVLETFTFPLHFIDFETSMVAIPFNKGDKPYQTIAFQFSHHILTQSGKVKHIGQYINLDNENPNIGFVRELKKQLSMDNGTVFRWSNHENTVLLYIRSQLDKLSHKECPDKTELTDFINTLTEEGEDRIGARTMVDMWVLYKKYHYMPETKGSNSIKYVLPSVINRFESMQNLLSNPVYGKSLDFTSLNFEEMTWIQKDEKNNPIDPYKLLPLIFDKYDRNSMDLLFGDDDLKNGGTAMMAYAVCQFKMMTVGEKEKIKQALLRYCELDTFAMVLIYLYWYEQCKMEYNTED
jgi:hypothetical protein